MPMAAAALPRSTPVHLWMVRLASLSTQNSDLCAAHAAEPT